MAEIGYIGENTDLILGQEFLTWLWFRSETGSVFRMEGEAHHGEPFNVAMEQRIVVRGGEGENQETATVVGSFSPLREARLGLLTGKQVVRCLVRLEKDGMDWQVSLKAEDFSINSLRTPKVARDDGDEDPGRQIDELALQEEVDVAVYTPRIRLAGARENGKAQRHESRDHQAKQE